MNKPQVHRVPLLNQKMRLCLGDLVTIGQTETWSPPAGSSANLTYLSREPAGSIGFLDYWIEDRNHPQGRFGVTDLFGIEPAYQQQGYGNLLFEEFEEIARSRDCLGTLSISILDSNRQVVQQFLEGRGYEFHRLRGNESWAVRYFEP